MIKDRPRRVDFEEVLGLVPAPQLEAGEHLVAILFQVGPSKADAPLDEGALEAWERRRGIELHPWQAEAIVAMSRAYMVEAHAATHWNALSPWPPAVKMWKYVRDQKAAPALKVGMSAPIKEKPHNVDRNQRSRNPPAG